MYSHLNNIHSDLSKLSEVENSNIIILLLMKDSSPSNSLENLLMTTYNNDIDNLDLYNIFLLDALDNENIRIISSKYNININCTPFTIIINKGKIKTFTGYFDIINEL